MNITELDSYNLADAVKFHNRLNPKIWGKDEHLLPEVRQKLLEIAADFQEFLGIDDLAVEDITVSGSNAAYSYTPHSDIDLHLVVRMPQDDEVYQELFNAKKYQYNDLMDIKIHGADVELYVQPADEAPVSLGEYSIKNNDWIQVPRKKRAKIDHSVVKHKYEDVKARIESALKEDDSDRVQALIDKIKEMRRAGLDAHGEFGAENLAFKMLRSQGWIKKLYDHRAATRARELSLKETPKKQFRYGFGEGHQGHPYSSEDGVAPTTCMFLNEDDTTESVVQAFIKDTAEKLGIEEMPNIELHSDDEWSVQHHSFGMYEPETHTLHVNLNDRHILDILRTVAHELAHCRQNELSKLPADAGHTGSPWEDEAHAVAGEIMRDYADANPEMFNENASGYIPKNKKEAQDPRYKMAVSVDIKPGQVGKEANKLALNTGRNGEPGLLMKTANLRESRMPQPSQGQGKYRELNQPLGPEFKPTMPKGTVRVDVSDVYDWYKLGKHIPNLDRARASEFGKGPPSTIVSFGSEEEEHKYINDLKKLGLSTTDIDPIDKNQPKGMPRQKVDPTYNVSEALAAQLKQELALFEEQDLFEIRMSPSNLRQEAAKTGAMAGMEFEMIVPNVGSVDDEPEYEPDYDQDQRSRSFDDIRDFFYDGDYNSRRDVNNLITEMQEQFAEWQDDQIMQSWDDEGFELLKEYIKDNGYFDDLEAHEEATNALQAEYGDDITPEDFEKMLDALVSEKFDEFVQDQWDNQGQYYDEALDEYRDEQRAENDEREWLDENYGYMSDIQRNFDIQWPYYYNLNDGDGERNIEEVAAEFEEAIGRPVHYSTSYHGAKRSPTAYSLEPDGSLDPDDSDDQGLEFISPPLPIDDIISDLNKVKAWAKDRGCYTNSSTGLHINISVPGYTLAKLDYVKLALLLGDEYILNEFGRSSNTYTKSALGKVRGILKQNPHYGQQVLDKMKGHMEDLATKAIHSGSTDKYTSINTKSGYIEFRSPGGDWLDENFSKVETTLLRFTVALSAAIDPQAYRQEYLKKLYKLLEPVSEESKGLAGKGTKDTVKYFADYVAGKTPRAALRSFVKQAQLERRIKKDPTGGQKYWWRVGLKSNPNYQIEVVGSSAAEAIDAAMDANEELMRYNRNTDFTTRPVRPYSDAPVKATVGEPEAIGQRSGPTVGGRPSNPAGRWVITPENDRQSVVYRFNAAGFDDANVVRRQWAQEHPGVWIVQRDDNQTLGQPAGSSRNALSQTDIENRLGWPDQTGDANYEVVDRRTMTPVFKFVANTDQDALRKYSQFLDVMMLPHDTENYGFREIALPGSTIDLQRQRAAQSDPYRSVPIPGVTDVDLDIPMAEPRPLGAGRELVGWSVRLPDGREVTQIRGIGNNQGDANRIAADWLRRNGYGVSGEGFEVVPVWGEA